MACATGSMIVSGDKRAPIHPEEVKVYLEPPASYETIALLEASINMVFSRQAAQDKAVQYLKKKAASLGANGILITQTGMENNGGTVGYVNEGAYVGSNNEKNMATQARAIYLKSTRR